MFSRSICNAFYCHQRLLQQYFYPGCKCVPYNELSSILLSPTIRRTFLLLHILSMISLRFATCCFTRYRSSITTKNLFVRIFTSQLSNSHVAETFYALVFIQRTVKSSLLKSTASCRSRVDLPLPPGPHTNAEILSCVSSAIDEITSA